MRQPLASDTDPRWTLLAHARGEAATPPVQAWLAGEFGGDPGDYAFERDPRGRPRLLQANLDCNWSHSGEGLLVALGRNLHVGIDLEWPRPRPRAQELARRFFHASEADWLDRLDAPARQRTFVRLWCAKEAVLKAHGHGLSFGLDKLVLVDTPGGLRLADCDPALGAPAQWTLEELAPFPGYVGALAWHPR